MVIRRIEILYDRLYGLDFLSVIPSDKLGFNNKIVHKGSPSGDRFLTKVLNRMNIMSEDCILDIGCAKGSAIKHMNKFPFKKTDGIDISKELTVIARKNFRILKLKRIEIFNENILKFKKLNNYTFFYLYNPFPLEIMKIFLSRLKKQIPLDKEVIIIYNNPVCHKQFLIEDFHLIKRFPNMCGTHIFVYSSIETPKRFLNKSL